MQAALTDRLDHRRLVAAVHRSTPYMVAGRHGADPGSRSTENCATKRVGHIVPAKIDRRQDGQPEKHPQRPKHQTL